VPGVTIYLFSPQNRLFFFFRSSLSLLLISLGCHAPGGCHPAPFHLSDLVYPLLFVNLSTKTFFPSGVTLWRVSSPPLPSPSDATASWQVARYAVVKTTRLQHTTHCCLASVAECCWTQFSRRQNFNKCGLDSSFRSVRRRRICVSFAKY